MKAYLIVLDNSQHVMIGRGGSSAGAQRQGWHLPGGTINPGETAAEAALRECAEETGYPIKTLPKAHVNGPVQHASYYDQHNANNNRSFLILTLAQHHTAIDASFAQRARLMRSIRRPGHPLDEPFNDVIWVSATDFNAHHNTQMTAAHHTDWFADPLDLYFNDPYETADLDDY
ncbi:NUDIX domain-containing protein [Pseudomonas sp. RGM2987]|uniref:NUDIX hydrolase n=1 Tax=Pseudomonas sp. RGM2987 TaxID=2930090 RepID=UPI001FD637B1|nr:NUDIX domain-containing protein [Pseudomonas sp. RGM2987]MCJ8205115.1 NUDIX hydrolase [Pseudomonas sp. RGM2987]